MVRYVMLVTYTEVGASQIQNTTRRAQMFHQVAERMGVTVESMYWTLGDLDAVATISADDEGTAVALSIFLAKQGYVRTRMLRAYTEAEFAGFLDRMPGLDRLSGLAGVSIDEGDD
jgi:uncharacterized protein with GYD domain